VLTSALSNLMKAATADATRYITAWSTLQHACIHRCCTQATHSYITAGTVPSHALTWAEDGGRGGHRGSPVCGVGNAGACSCPCSKACCSNHLMTQNHVGLTSKVACRKSVAGFAGKAGAAEVTVIFCCWVSKVPALAHECFMPQGLRAAMGACLQKAGALARACT
jgi:hypothetical protein